MKYFTTKVGSESQNSMA